MTRLSASWKRLGRVLAGRSATGAGMAVRWLARLPGVAGAGAVSYGVAAVVHGVFRQVPELGAALAIVGVFLLLIDRNT